MSEAMGTGMQVVNHWIPSLVFMLKRRVDWMEWNCCMRLPRVWDLRGRMEWWYDKEEDNHSNGVFFYVASRHFTVKIDRQMTMAKDKTREQQTNAGSGVTIQASISTLLN